ncbi:MAG: hypothetical protein IPJ38_23090 [Dechloromonas sp.]|uniref:Uncharacterized protein n=1 Tax=Candidatus Dechloromonas phosphorivorans TaxID=2899244 RepID=A0A935K3B5_9RHOO|nr:hypothetical protein [Candidatus Dechloromonas phosphorivorans]
MLPLKLDQSVELLLRDGQLTGDVRFPGKLAAVAPGSSDQHPWIKAELTPERARWCVAA